MASTWTRWWPLCRPLVKERGVGSACGAVPGTVRASECYRVHDEVTTHPPLHGVVTSETPSEIAPRSYLHRAAAYFSTHSSLMYASVIA